MVKIPVIIDTDPGVDDIVAILLALASPEIDPLAYIVSFGNTDIDASFLNIQKTFQAVQKHIHANPTHAARFPNFNGSTIPILARGCDGPLQGDVHSAQYFHGRDGLGNIAERHIELNYEASHDLPLSNTEHSGVQVTLDLLRKYPERSITYIALGPLTNLAKVMQADAHLFRSRIGRVVCMGGALDVPGNTTPVAEFNFFADPFAVKELLHSTDGLPLDRVLILPLDITTPHELPFPVYNRLVDTSFHSPSQPSIASNKSPLVHFTSSFLERTRSIMLQFGKDAMELHDIVAVWCAIEHPPIPTTPDSLWKYAMRHFDVERTGELTRGMLVVDRREDEGAYELGSNRSQVHAERLAAQVEAETEQHAEAKPPLCARCVTHTPGPGVILEILLGRIWGVEHPGSL